MIDLLLGVLCEVRSVAHQDAHGGLRLDSSWHVAHGERPTCDGGDTGLSGPVSVPSDTNDYDDNDKSRYCRRHWFC